MLSPRVETNSRERSESLYDAYLDACLTDGPEEPEAFFSQHPEIDATGRARIRALFEVLAEGKADAERPPWDRLGGYRILRRLGAGAMGDVFLAEQESLRRLVALKVIRPGLGASRTAVARFTREAEAVARLRHPNVVRVLELGEEGGARYIAMEYIPGRPLSEVLAAGIPHPSRVLAWGEDIARALGEAHRRGVVHRDVKPGNILISPEGRAVLLDFGVARLAESATKLTRSFAGSPSYAAPEQLTDGEVDGRTDVYGLGVTLYECLTGHLPFTGETVEAIFARILREEPIRPRQLDASLPVDLETVVLKAMAKRPADRFAAAADLAHDLASLREGQSIRARPPSLPRRLGARARAHPARTTALAAAAVVVLAFAGTLLVGERLRVRARRDEARAAVADALDRVAARRKERIVLAPLRTRLAALTMALGDSWLTDDDDRELREISARLETSDRRREAAFYEVLELLRRAEQLDPDVAGTDAVRARLYLERMEEALERKNFEEAALYRGLSERHDPDGEVTAHLRRPARLTIVTDPPGARVRIERETELPERRFVPEPLDPPPAGPLVTPIEDLELEPGDYRAVLDRDGFGEAVVPLRLDPAEEERRTVRLPAIGEAPAGFVFVPASPGGHPGFFLMEHEVTCGEYLEFLNDPATLAEIAAASRLIRVPRDAESMATGGSWPRGPAGEYRLPSDWAVDWPTLGVSYEDAVAYARWRSERDGRDYGLPDREQWTRAAGVEWRRVYVFGNVWRPRWVNSCFSRPRPSPEPVMSYPVDRSYCGAFDMTGSAAEWIDDFFDRPRGSRRLAGSSWAHADPDLFRIWGGIGAAPDFASHTFGFRLAMRRRPR